jgi:hypothetical protein
MAALFMPWGSPLPPTMPSWGGGRPSGLLSTGDVREGEGEGDEEEEEEEEEA